jgi:hypothetical protein
MGKKLIRKITEAGSSRRTTTTSRSTGKTTTSYSKVKVRKPKSLI